MPGARISSFSGLSRISPQPGHTFCASLRSRNARQHFRKATLHRNLQEKCRRSESTQNVDTHFVRACAVEMQADISQEPLYTEKNAAAQLEHPDQAPACTTTVRTLQCGHTVWGMINPLEPAMFDDWGIFIIQSFFILLACSRLSQNWPSRPMLETFPMRRVPRWALENMISLLAAMHLMVVGL